MSGFFGKAIRDNKNDPVTMRRDILDILDHYSSTPENPRHENCPTGPKSRCSYNRDIATGESTHRPVLNPFSDSLYKLMKPIFERLADPGLLESCKKLSTQNANESLHHVIWALAPKNQFNSPHECELAFCLGVCLFNDGVEHTMIHLYKKLNLAVTESSLAMWQRIDSDRVESAEYRARQERKDKRKILKTNRVKRDVAFKKNEGVTYKSSGFY